MRAAFALVLAATLGACGSDGSGGDDDTTMTPDSPTATTHDLLIESPDIAIDPGQEITYCWYFRTPNTKMLAIKHWQSTMTPGSHHMILFTSTTDLKPPGTVSAVDCGVGGSNFPVWTYSAQTPEADLALPADDGTGKPVAMELPPNQAGFFQMHYNNRSDQQIKAHVVVTGDALPDGAAYTKTAAYVTFNGNISIPPMTAPTPGDLESMSANVTSTSKFWLMTTHAHKHAIHTDVRDGTTTGAMVVESTDWEHPTVQRWEAPFYSFGTGKLTYECTYYNPTVNTIRTGDSAQTDEMCMASGYFFPASKPVFCYNTVCF
jgi:hypothetical protein